MQGTQYATKRSILCRGAFCGPTPQCLVNVQSYTFLLFVAWFVVGNIEWKIISNGYLFL